MARQFTDQERAEIMQGLCERMATGMFLTAACAELNVSPWTVRNWRLQDKSLHDMLDAAWDLGIEALAAQNITIADGANPTTVETEERDGSGKIERKTVRTEDNVHRDRLRVYAREKAISTIMARFIMRKPTDQPPAPGAQAPGYEDRYEFTDRQLEYIIEHGELPPSDLTEELTP